MIKIRHVLYQMKGGNEAISTDDYWNDKKEFVVKKREGRTHPILWKTRF